MKNAKKVAIIMLVAIAIVMGGYIAYSLAVQPEYQPQIEVFPGQIADDEADASVWGEFYPEHWESYQRNYEMRPTRYNGSVPEDKTIMYPYLPIIYGGMGFAEDYLEDRGHVYSVEDIRHIHESRRPLAVCWTCKSSQAHLIIEREGVDYYSMAWGDLEEEVVHPIGCLNCHNPEDMSLTVRNPAFIEAMDRLGIDVADATQQEMRSYVCGQCHVEYYFRPDDKYLIFPWDNGFHPDDIERYFDDIGFNDWTHAITGAEVIKIQHPEFELWSLSTHGQAGVSCADCHMPYVRVGNTKMSSHHWQSPLNTLNESCRTCHIQSVDWLRQQVYDRQDKTKRLLDIAAYALVDAIEEIALALEEGNYNEQSLEEARYLQRRAQLRVDFFIADNSTGAHNPTLALEVLGVAIEQAHEARKAAEMARLGELYEAPRDIQRGEGARDDAYLEQYN
ncbi:ammonia-forming cytochrome c nitrite reductase subunit c552 [Desulfuribacillus alkaliarsenatis]|uniref:nitrite reductase (cytochrome; ammonia-forming) n=1 Tax=Desulfuribacillus alkaliarsenatis TaxID=766136 RepID=A0A1E5G554_9FIRM|nr:ammonia-forming cytochrome c nitrite reductase subunit c552 [Desulfuribacillus alkaliarsenatis]OEF98298.1 hypothetical protein BHF68_01050 [Desulfuribacillus alkaliarsenatis]